MKVRYPSGVSITLEGEVLRVTYESEASGFRVLRLSVDGKQTLTVVGVFPRVYAGARVRVSGTYQKDAVHGEQLRADGLTVLEPKTLEGLEKYLGSGVMQGVGATYAKRIVEAFGTDTLRVLDEAPERLLEVGGLGKKRVEAIVAAWRDNRALHDVMVFLQSHGATPALAARIVKRYGQRAAQVVADEPYRLALDVSGIGFRTADRIAESVGVARDSPLRHQAGLLQVLRDQTEQGHTYAETVALFAETRVLLGDDVDDESLARGLTALVAGGHVVVDGDRYGREKHAYATDVFESEARLARRLVSLVKSEPLREIALDESQLAEVEKGAGVALSEEQKVALRSVVDAPFVVVTGGPGVGKTTLLRAILALYRAARFLVRLAAPTGRAAKRMSESSGGEAVTLHRLLEFDPKTAAFKRDENLPLEGDAFVIDETSMVDVRMCDALLRAIPDGKRVLFVGDVDQLPSVGPGAVLFDMIASEVVPVVRLTKIFRQAETSRIILAAHAVNRGELPESGERGEESDFFMVRSKNAESTSRIVRELVETRIPRKFGLDPVRDVQVLTPMNRGPLGTFALNEVLQAELNPSPGGLRRGTRLYKTGDKVMQTKNDYDREVFNGDVGLVARLLPDDAGLVVTFADREVVYESKNLDDLVLAYACTVHKSQGSEYPAVVVPLSSSHFVMLAKNLVYTAMTRGRKLVVLVCEPRALELALSPDRWREIRRTGLVKRLVFEASRHAAGVSDRGVSDPR